MVQSEGTGHRAGAIEGEMEVNEELVCDSHAYA
jgi:hypothetical protein